MRLLIPPSASSSTAVTFAGVVVSGLLAVPPILAQTRNIHIRVLDGKSGRPIAHESITDRIDPRQPDAKPPMLTTDAEGRIAVDLPAMSGVNATVKQHPTCRHVAKQERTQPPMTFPVDDVVAKGVVEANACSRINVVATVGELTLFVRPLRLWERLSD